MAWGAVLPLRHSARRPALPAVGREAMPCAALRLAVAVASLNNSGRLALCDGARLRKWLMPCRAIQ